MSARTLTRIGALIFAAVVVYYTGSYIFQKGIVLQDSHPVVVSVDQPQQHQPEIQIGASKITKQQPVLTNTTSTTPVDTSSTPTCYYISGFDSCPHFQGAKHLGERLKKLPNVKVEVIGVSRPAWDFTRSNWQKEIPGASSHRTSPFTWQGCDDGGKSFIGGNDKFQAYIRSKHPQLFK
ncbi:hypothetical protein SmJEL517_g01993 [Synchytrium microbalum]|uniref:Uncharacterized protein n=1 Tax=Synchytrium microbalum TaxID=1806994 RepID=A0A507CD05_9FUNG|nr:uncharacterized protein SmJEL517_g01993 [Synchytrium microbalum]TPX35804.1 hypothetical protein SmJEL517_g01993 [Synchytrium microbalum]